MLLPEATTCINGSIGYTIWHDVLRMHNSCVNKMRKMDIYLELVIVLKNMISPKE